MTGKRIVLWSAAVWMLLSLCAPAMAKTQVIPLRIGWNLVALSVQPTDASVDAIFRSIGDKFKSVWQMNPANSQWLSYPPPLSGLQSIDTLTAGNGYWVKVKNSVDLVLNGSATLPSGSLTLRPGWNLVGFPIEKPMEYRNLLTGVSFSQLWTYDVESGQFKGVERSPGTQTILREDFVHLQPGTAYWVKVDRQIDLGPVLGTALEGDIDQPPLLTPGKYGERILWKNVTAGDEDIGGDGWYDWPNTQRTLTFRDNQIEKRISVNNLGKGLLKWKAEILNPAQNRWLKIIGQNDKGERLLLTAIEGEQAQNTAYLRLQADRTRLAVKPAGYDAILRLTSNGVSGAEQTSRDIKVHMDVADIVGDYDLLVKIASANGTQADMHNPRYYVSIYKDRHGIKAIIDHRRSLLMSRRFYMTGFTVRNDANQFALSGSIILPPKGSKLAGSELNPYKVQLQRDITLIGTRSEVGDPGLGPLDLKGEYRETIRNVLSQPIYLAGTFEAVRTKKWPLVTDEIKPKTDGDRISDDGSLLKSVIKVAERLLITEVDAMVNLSHTRKEDLRVSLRSPSGTVVRLRDHSSAPLGRVTYDTTAVPINPMESFRGEMSNGDWTLTVEDDVAGETGTLIEWSLYIRGTKIYSLGGAVSGVPDGVTVQLTGCGITRTTTVRNGRYQFDNLIECKYQVKIIHAAYSHYSMEVLLNGGNIANADLRPQKIVAAVPDFRLFPLSGNRPLRVEMRDITNLDPSTDYHHRWTIYKHTAGSAVSQYAQIADQGKYASHTIADSGVYHVKLEIEKTAKPGTAVHTIDKTDKYIIVGRSIYGEGENLPAGDRRILHFIHTSGSGGRSSNNRFTLYQADSATFDIDRPPLIDASNDMLGTEDSDYFLGAADGIDLATGTNKKDVNGNGKIDPPLGANAAKIRVSIGQQIIGASYSGSLQLSIGANP